MTQKKFDTALHSHRRYGVPLMPLLRTPIVIAVSMLAAAAAHAEDWHFTDSDKEKSISGTQIIDSIKVDDDVNAIIKGSGDNSTLIYGKGQDFRLGGVNENTSSSLDMSSVDKFVFNNANKIFSIGGQYLGTDPSRSTGTLEMARENIITTSIFGVGHVNNLVPQNVEDYNTGKVILGQKNIVNANRIIIGTDRGQGSLQFGEHSDSSLTLRATDGYSRVAHWEIAGLASSFDKNSQTIGTVDLANGTLDARIDNLLIGEVQMNYADAIGILSMGQGILDANIITLGKNSSTSEEPTARGTLTVKGGTVLAKKIILGVMTDTTAGKISAEVNLQDGATLRARSIEAGADSLVGTASATRVINWDNGSIGNYAEDEDMRISGIDIKLTDGDAHTFQIDGSKARATISAVLSDADNPTTGGGLVKAGSGTLILSAANTYTGNTIVNAGALQVDGSLVSATTVNNGGLLGGSGTVKNVAIADGGAITNGMGTLTINGNLEMAEGGRYQVSTNTSFDINKIDVKGNVTLNNNLVELRAAAGNYENDRHLTLLTSDNTINGQFADVISDLAFLDARLTQDEKEVTLDLTRNGVSFADVARSANQRGVASILDRTAGSASGDSETVIKAITALSADQAAAAYAAIGGSGLVTAYKTAHTFANGFQQQLHTRLSALPGATNTMFASAPVLLAVNETSNSAQPGFSLGQTQPLNSDGHGFWLRTQGNQITTNSDDNTAGSRERIRAISAGFDTRISNEVVLGVATSHGSNDFTAAHNERGNASSNGFALYGSYASGPWNVLTSAGVARTTTSMQRDIVFGSIDRTAHANFASHSASLAGEVSYAIDMSNWILQPLAGLSVNYHYTDSFKETGADTLNLQVAGQSTTSVKSQIGAKAILGNDTVQWLPRLTWAHEFGNSNAAMSAQLQGLDGNFAIRGVNLPRDSVIAGLGVSAKAAKQVALFADVQGEFNARERNVGVMAGLRASW